MMFHSSKCPSQIGSQVELKEGSRPPQVCSRSERLAMLVQPTGLGQEFRQRYVEYHDEHLLKRGWCLAFVSNLLTL